MFRDGRIFKLISMAFYIIPFLKVEVNITDWSSLWGGRKGMGEANREKRICAAPLVKNSDESCIRAAGRRCVADR